MLRLQDTALLVIDVQEKLTPAMCDREAFLETLKRTVQAAGVLELPVVCTEHNSAGLGETIDEVASLMEAQVIAKIHFSCCSEPGFLDEVQKLNRSQLLLTGMETHICVYQTAVELVEAGYEVHVIGDAVASRTAANKQIGLEKMKDAGVSITSFEAAVFELLRVATGEKFKAILQIVK